MAAETAGGADRSVEGEKRAPEAAMEADRGGRRERATWGAEEEPPDTAREMKERSASATTFDGENAKERAEDKSNGATGDKGKVARPDK